MSKSKNDDAWEKIFDKYAIINTLQNSDSFLISSSDINNFRQARLMTKFDHRSQLPKLFVDNNLSILPVSRGSYVIGEFETFHAFTRDDTKVKRIDFPIFLESLNYENITSEATAINCAFVSEIIHDFTGEEHLHPTVSGRMSSSSFGFDINSNNGLFKVSVENSQIEIDGGYEGESSLNIIEAKNYISDDFLVRQLFYPYRLWLGKIKKKIRPIFLTYTNGIFHLREYAFKNSEHYNSIELVKQRKYAFQDTVINIETIQQVLNNTRIIDEPEIPFPQADSFERLINLCELLNQKDILMKEEITENYDFNSRQTDYYCNAGKYLKLLERTQINDSASWILTSKGKNILNLSMVDRQLEFVKLILSHAAFNDALKVYFQNGQVPTKQEIILIMRSHDLWRISSDTTYQRRSSTIISWINWIIDLVEE